MICAITKTGWFLPFVCMGMVGALALFFLLIYDRFFCRHLNKEEMLAFSKQFNKRLLRPDFEALERHFGCNFPREIKDFYKNRDEVLKENFELVAKQEGKANQIWRIAYYQPADLDNVRDAWPDTNEVFEFANDGCGNGYTINPRLENPPVMFYDHETGEWDKVADNFFEFMALAK